MSVVKIVAGLIITAAAIATAIIAGRAIIKAHDSNDPPSE